MSTTAAAPAAAATVTQAPAEFSPQRGAKKISFAELAQICIDLIAKERRPTALLAAIESICSDGPSPRLWLFLLGQPTIDRLSDGTCTADVLTNRLAWVSQIGIAQAEALANAYTKYGLTLCRAEEFVERHPCADAFSCFGGTAEATTLTKHCVGRTCPYAKFPQKVCHEYMYFGTCSMEHSGAPASRQQHRGVLHVVVGGAAINQRPLYAHAIAELDNHIASLQTAGSLVTLLALSTAPSPTLMKRLASRASSRKAARGAREHVQEQLGVLDYELDTTGTLDAEATARQRRLARIRNNLNPR